MFLDAIVSEDIWVLGNFLGHFSFFPQEQIAFKTKQLRSVLGKFLRPNYLQILWLKYFMKLLQRNC